MAKRARDERDGELRAAPESLAGIADVSTSLVGIAVHERLVYANPVARRLLEAGGGEPLAQRSIYELVHADDRESARAIVQEALRSGRGRSWETVRLVASDGSVFAGEVWIAPIRLGDSPALLIVGRDASAQRRAEAELRDSERRHERLAAAVPVVIFRIDAAGRCTYLNDRWTELTGVPVASALERGWLGLVHPDDQGLAVQAWLDALRARAPLRSEQRIRHADGRTLWVLAQAAPETDTNGEITGWVGSLTDLTDLKAAEAARAHSEERLRVALDAANQCSWEWEVGSEHVEWSPGAARIFGLPEGELPTHPDQVVALAGTVSEAVLERGRAALQRGEPFEVEVELAREGEPTRIVQSTGEARRSAHGKGMRLIGVIRDVTASRRLAEERAALEAKLRESARLESLGLLAGGVAHDFNNLLVGVLGNAELALAGLPRDAPVARRLEEIRRAGARAAELAQQILTYSGHGAISTEPVELHTLAEETLALLRAALPASTALRLESGAEPAVVDGDPTQLRQVLMNLVTNASEALPATGGEVEVRVDARSAALAPGGDGDAAARPCVAIEVSDSGCGIAPDARARIFDPFFTTRRQGRGLGLAVVHGIVRSHHGSIEVESEPGRGTRMRVLLPRSSARVALAPPVPRAEPAGATGALVLVVDDERAVRDVVRLTLEAAGYRVLPAASGAEASALLRRFGGEVAAVLLDLTLGPESGEAVLKEIRALDPTLPVLATSGYPADAAYGRLAAQGIAGFVQKPFTPARLVSELSLALGTRVR